MTRPAVLVLAVPHDHAVEIGDALRARDAYEVVVPDIAAGEAPPADRHFEGLISTMAVPGHVADVVIELPHGLDRPLTVTTGGISVWMAASVDHPIDDAINALDGVLLSDVSHTATAATAATPA